MIRTRRCICRHCAAPATETAAADLVHDPVELPAAPRAFRVHSADRPPLDCTLHPDGTLTTTVGGETLRNAFSFDAMRERNWAAAFIEWDPQPLAEESELEQAVEVVQELLAL